MKKPLYKLLIGLNISVIAIILLISGILLYFSSSDNHQIFGYSAFLFHDNQLDQDDADLQNQQYSLLIVESRDEPRVGDKATFFVRDDYSNKIQFVDTIKSIKEEVAIFEGTEYTVGIDSDLFIGKVIAQNDFWGMVIAAAVNSKNTFLIYGILVGFFVAISGILITLMIVRAKQGKSDDEPTEEDILLMNYGSDTPVGTGNNSTDKPLDSTVFPHRLSHPRLSKSNPLFEPRAARSARSVSEPPKNLGTSLLDKKSGKPDSLGNGLIDAPPIEAEDIKLYNFDKNGNPVFLENVAEKADDIALDEHTIIISDAADTGELIKLGSRADTLNDISSVRNDAVAKQPIPQPDFIDSSLDFDSLVNEIIHNAEEDFFKNND